MQVEFCRDGERESTVLKLIWFGSPIKQNQNLKQNDDYIFLCAAQDPSLRYAPFKDDAPVCAARDGV